MPLFPATPADLTDVATLVNSAYRGDSSRQGWTTEADLLGGQRTDPQTLARDLAAEPGAALLVLRETAAGPALGTAWLQPAEGETWYVGMLTVRPELQDRGLGRGLLEAVEGAALERGARRLRMTVINLRETLIAWYLRRGYQPTGETEPFPYGDARFGLPLRDDLHFVVLEKPLGPSGVSDQAAKGGGRKP
ncbi:GNAT family N-acetyltransferase [Phenylobacterium deserti]|uniref:GNAT family N-acetyltransferase n=1 Tax=Phenylobacterium deserti TaxID=1914756 RepID=A0A328AWS5_9CAUL|nr:GNAT family N-acetyltransferase [Phenylobacterium deserti]RAK58156.1 GNAT family N-acetyltransferase [Phenylobacterium deserti]